MLTDETESAAFLAAYGMIWRAIGAEPAALGVAESNAVLRAFGFRLAETSNGALPLSLSVLNDPVFGRIIQITAAGRRAVALPPLNKELAAPLAAAAHRALRTATGVDLGTDPIQDCAIRLANLAVEVPEIVSIELEVAGLEDGELLIQPVRISVAVPERTDAHLSIHPYPRELEERIRLKEGRAVVVRPIRIEDIRLYHQMLNLIPKNELFLRFCNQFGDAAQAIPTEMLANLIHFDYSRDMTFIAIAGDSAGTPEALGVVDAFPTPGRDQAEYSILIRSDMAGTGLGKALMTKIIEYCRSQGVASLFGLVLRKNQRMLGLCARLGFSTVADEDDDDMVKVVLPL
jgi:acetyltransferase